jgi:ABC-2 type transport system permease protein
VTAEATSVSRSLAVGRRVLDQLRGDRRFLAVSIVAPLVVIFLLKTFWEAIDTALLDQTRFAVPAAVFIVHFVTYVLTAIVLVRERVNGTMERMFVDGYSPGSIVAGYLGGYTGLATVQSLLILLEVNLLFEIDFDLADNLQVFVVMWLMAMVSLALGTLVSNAARNEGQVFPFIPLVMIPPVFLSGLVVAVDRLPEWAQALARVVPLSYAVEVVNGIVAGGTMFDSLGALVMLPIFAVGILVLAARTLRERA